MFPIAEVADASLWTHVGARLAKDAWLLVFLAEGLVVMAIIRAAIYLAASRADGYDINQAILGSARANDVGVADNANPAIAIRLGSALLAGTIGMTGIIGGFAASTDVLNNALNVAGYSVLLLGLLFVARAVNNRFILPGIDNTFAMASKRNLAVAVVEGCSYIATGFIAAACLGGEGGGFWQTIVFFALGQGTLVGATKLVQAITPYDDLEEIGKGNVAAGVFLGGIIIALSVVMAASLKGDSHGWVADITNFAWSTTEGLAVMAGIAWLVQWLFFVRGEGNTNLATEIGRDANWGAAYLTAAIQTGSALLIASAIV